MLRSSCLVNWLVNTYRGAVPNRPLNRQRRDFPPDIVLLDKLHRPGEVGKLFVLYEYEQEGEAVEMFMRDFLDKAGKWEIKIGEVRRKETVDMGKEVSGQGTVFAKIVEETAHDSIPPAVLYFGSRGRQLEGQVELLQVRHGVRIMWFERERSLHFKREDRREEMFLYCLREFNEKIGGRNYELNPTSCSDNVLVIGYSVAHPRDKRAQPIPEEMRDELPSVVAFSANSTEPNTFLGDFDFQPAWQEQVSDNILLKRMKLALEKRRTSAGGLPDQIVLIRDGFPDRGANGDYSELLREVSIMERACAEFQPGYLPNFSVVRVSTGPENNHTYEDVLHADENTSLDTHELMEKLCFPSQITGFPASIPKPMNVAYFTARRGGMVFSAYKDHGFALPRVSQPGEPSLVEDPIPNGAVDWENLSEVLSFKGKRCEIKDPQVKDSNDSIHTTYIHCIIPPSFYLMYILPE